MKKKDNFENADWYGTTVETDKVQFEDEVPTGKPIVLRQIDFKFKPDLEKLPDEKQIREDHQKAIEAILWKDGLVLIDELRVTIDAEKKTYTIFAPVQPKRGDYIWGEKQRLKTLKDIIEPNDKRG